MHNERNAEVHPWRSATKIGGNTWFAGADDSGVWEEFQKYTRPIPGTELVTFELYEAYYTIKGEDCTTWDACSAYHGVLRNGIDHFRSFYSTHVPDLLK
jgi:hypothetical protein